MRSYVLAACLAVLVAAAAAEENVVTITGQASFDETVSGADFVVVEFYAPWCGHCKRLAPEYEKAATTLKEEGSKIVLAKVDATDDSNKDLASKFGVRGYPTLKVFRNGDSAAPSDYEGPREADGIVKHVKKISGPPSVVLADADAVAAFKEAESVPVIGYFSSEDSDAYKTYTKAADGLRSDYGFAHVSDAALIKEECPDCADGSIVAVNKLEKKVDVLTDLKDMKDWLAKVTKPLVITFGDNPIMRKALGAAFQPGSAAKVIAMAKGDSDEPLLEAITEMAKEDDSLTYMFADKSMDLFDRVKSHFGVEDEAKLPCFIINNDDGKWHSFAVEDYSTLKTFVADWKEGKVEKTIKSADVPEEPYEEDVRVVVAKNFDEVIFGGKDVLIEFYAPWCGHCKNLAPTYSKVGAKFKGNDKVEIAKMDATANDVPSSKFNVKGFPTIYFVKGADGSVISYDGARSEEGFVDFIKKHASASSGTHDEL